MSEHLSEQAAGVDRIADVLIDHHDELDGFCSCLWQSDFKSDIDSSTQIAYHVAAVVMAERDAETQPSDRARVQQIVELQDMLAEARAVLGAVAELADEWTGHDETVDAIMDRIRRILAPVSGAVARHEQEVRADGVAAVHRLRCYRCGHSFSGRRSNIDTRCPACGVDSFTNADVRFGRADALTEGQS